jgi:single-stranded-DNA-specific exonuclease
VTLREGDFPHFAELFETAVREMLPPELRARQIETDGSLDAAYLDLALAQLLGQQIWGQAFPQPLFCDEFEVVSQRVVGEKHLKLKLSRGGRSLEAIRFNELEPLPARMRAAYRLDVNEFNGRQSLQLIIDHWETAN